MIPGDNSCFILRQFCGACNVEAIGSYIQGQHRQARYVGSIPERT